MPTELELIALKTEFDLYLGFVKRLVLDLPDCNDRTRAALWLQKLRSVRQPDQMKLRNEHLKLFLFALHRRALVGIFEKPPPKEELESFHDGLTLLEMTRELIEITEKKKTEGKKEGEEGFGLCPLPAVSTNISYDLKEYAACQEIPKFGAHVFYAVSKEPIQMWTKPPQNVFPDKGSVPNQLEWETALSNVTDHVLEREAEIDAVLAAEKEKETGFVFDEGPEEKTEDKQLRVVVCPGTPTFRWDANSPLNIYQNYNFAEVGLAEDLEDQGKHQLELDETAFSVLDDSLPGRQRVNIRSPYFEGLPPDIAERRYHGVVDEIPEPDEDEPCDGPPCENDMDNEASGTENKQNECPSSPTEQYGYGDSPGGGFQTTSQNFSDGGGYQQQCSQRQPNRGGFQQQFSQPQSYGSGLQQQFSNSQGRPRTACPPQQQSGNAFQSQPEPAQQQYGYGFQQCCNTSNNSSLPFQPPLSSTFDNSFNTSTSYPQNSSFPKGNQSYEADPQCSPKQEGFDWLTALDQPQYQQPFSPEDQSSMFNRTFERDRPMQPDLTNTSLANPNLSFNYYNNMNTSNVNSNPFNNTMSSGGGGRLCYCGNNRRSAQSGRTQ